jgi:hypothetical protein
MQFVGMTSYKDASAIKLLLSVSCPGAVTTPMLPSTFEWRPQFRLLSVVDRLFCPSLV